MKTLKMDIEALSLLYAAREILQSKLPNKAFDIISKIDDYIVNQKSESVASE